MNELFLHEVAKEIMDNAFDEKECFEILKKHFGKAYRIAEQQDVADVFGRLSKCWIDSLPH